MYFFKCISSNQVENFSKQEKEIEKPLEIVKELPKEMDGEEDSKFFKCYEYGHLQVDCPKRKVITIEEIEKIDLEIQETQQDSYHESPNQMSKTRS